MGTRADFYIGRGEQAQWLGSVAWDGGPYGFDDGLLGASTEEGFRAAMEKEFAGRDDVTRPSEGWPWPWADSRTTDYAYAFEGGSVWASCFGCEWFPANAEPDEHGPKTATFPDMTEKQKVKRDGPGSGLLVVTAG